MLGGADEARGVAGAFRVEPGIEVRQVGGREARQVGATVEVQQAAPGSGRLEGVGVGDVGGSRPAQRVGVPLDVPGELVRQRLEELPEARACGGLTLVRPEQVEERRSRDPCSRRRQPDDEARHLGGGYRLDAFTIDPARRPEDLQAEHAS
jgi:hypothetical protein